MQHKPDPSNVATSTRNPFTELRTRLDSWRQARRRGERIPEALWRSAARLARRHGLSAACTALHLNYYDLQRRLGVARRARTAPVAPPTFVTLPPAAVPLADPGTLEITHPHGARLTLRLPRAQARELLLCVNAFLRS